MGETHWHAGLRKFWRWCKIAMSGGGLGQSHRVLQITFCEHSGRLPQKALFGPVERITGVRIQQFAAGCQYKDLSHLRRGPNTFTQLGDRESVNRCDSLKSAFGLRKLTFDEPINSLKALLHYAPKSLLRYRLLVPRHA